MSGRLEASDLANGILSMKAVGESDFEVWACDAPVGQIMRRRRSFGRVVWFWSLSGPHMPETMGVAGSNAQTLEGAMLAIKRVFDSWLQSATGEPGNMLWDKSESHRLGQP
jgi:hypothetical protein